MSEFMLLIRNDSDAKEGMPPDKHQQFVKDCEAYIESLKNDGKMISAQPLVREGKMISGTPGAFRESAYADTHEVIVGYYHIYAKDLAEAIAIAKGNPEFAYSSKARIEVRPVKTIERSTSYAYPTAEKSS